MNEVKTLTRMLFYSNATIVFLDTVRGILIVFAVIYKCLCFWSGPFLFPKEILIRIESK